MEVEVNEGLETEELLLFFKALSDGNRLKIVGLLAKEPMTVEQIAGALNLHSSTTSHHLSRLSKAGLVSARAEGYYNIYHLETSALEAMARRLLAKETLPAVFADEDLDAYDKKVLKAYLTPEGRLKRFPVQLKKLQAILRYAIKFFEPGVHYTEKQVNEILSQLNEDTAGLRRDLVDAGLMKRLGDGGEYWRV
jgi:DNA-binding transcriptional ArsR family regulator